MMKSILFQTLRARLSPHRKDKNQKKKSFLCFRGEQTEKNFFVLSFLADV